MKPAPVIPKCQTSGEISDATKLLDLWEKTCKSQELDILWKFKWNKLSNNQNIFTLSGEKDPWGA